MLPERMLVELRKLNRIEKLQIIQLLASELANEEGTAFQASEYEVWSPLDAAGAANTLMQMLEDEKKSRDA